jgi:hypothetical protein
LCEQEDLIASDFASEFGIRIATADLSWREFRAYLAGLMSTDSRLRRHFAPDDYNPKGVENGGW